MSNTRMHHALGDMSGEPTNLPDNPRPTRPGPSATTILAAIAAAAMVLAAVGVWQMKAQQEQADRNAAFEDCRRDLGYYSPGLTDDDYWNISITCAERTP